MRYITVCNVYVFVRIFFFIMLIKYFQGETTYKNFVEYIYHQYIFIIFLYVYIALYGCLLTTVVYIEILEYFYS